MLLGTQDKDFFPEDILEKLEFVILKRYEIVSC